MPYLNALIGAGAAVHGRRSRCTPRCTALRPAPDRLTGFYLAMSVGGALGGVFAGLIAPVVFDWTYEYPLLILAAGLLVPQIFLLAVHRAAVDDAGARGVASRVLAIALVVALIVLVGLSEPRRRCSATAHEDIAFLVDRRARHRRRSAARLPYVIVLAGALFAVRRLSRAAAVADRAMRARAAISASIRSATTPTCASWRTAPRSTASS